MTTAAIYARLSNENEGSTSTKRQEKECRDFAQMRGLEVIDVFVDEGISGFSGKHRPSFERAINALEAGEFDNLIVWKLDRLTRQGMGAVGSLLDRLDGTGRGVISVMDGGLDTTQQNGRVMVALLSEMARAESANTSTRIRAQKREACEAGKWLSGSNVPWGYVMTADKKLAHCPETAATARQVIEMYLSGQSVANVIDWLNEEGIPSPRSKGWSRATLNDWIDSPVLAGLQPIYENHRSEIYRSPATGEPVSVGHGLATEAEWRSIRSLREQRRTTNNRRGTSTAKRAFAGLIFCDRCKGKMSVAGSAWRCNDERTKRTCTGCSIRPHLLEPHLEAMILNRITALAIDDPIIVRVAEAWRGEIEPLVNMAGLELHLADLEARLDSLIEDRYQKNRFAGREAMFDSLFDNINDEIKTVKEGLSTIPSSNPCQHFVDFSDQEIIRMAWDSASVKDKHAVAVALVDSVMVERRGRGGGFDPTRIEVVWRD